MSSNKLRNKRDAATLLSDIKTGMVIVFKKGTRAGQLAPLITALRDSGLVDSVQVFTEIIE